MDTSYLFYLCCLYSGVHASAARCQKRTAALIFRRETDQANFFVKEIEIISSQRSAGVMFVLFLIISIRRPMRVRLLSSRVGV